MALANRVRATGAPVRAVDLEALKTAARTAGSPPVGAGLVASLAMRLNADAIDDYVVIEAGHSAPSFRLSGSGWYETDFKKDGDKKKNLTEAAKPAETKPAEAKPAASKPSSE